MKLLLLSTLTFSGCRLAVAAPAAYVTPWSSSLADRLGGLLRRQNGCTGDDAMEHVGNGNPRLSWLYTQLSVSAFYLEFDLSSVIV